MPISVDLPPRPDGPYGATKLFGERLGKSLAAAFDLTFIALRLGWIQVGANLAETLPDDWARAMWLSNGDLIRLFDCAVEAELDERDVRGRQRRVEQPGEPLGPERRGRAARLLPRGRRLRRGALKPRRRRHGARPSRRADGPGRSCRAGPASGIPARSSAPRPPAGASPPPHPRTDVDRRAQPDDRAARPARGRHVDAQQILLELHQRLGRPLQRRALPHVVSRIAEELHDREQVVQVASQRLRLLRRRLRPGQGVEARPPQLLHPDRDRIVATLDPAAVLDPFEDPPAEVREPLQERARLGRARGTRTPSAPASPRHSDRSARPAADASWTRQVSRSSRPSISARSAGSGSWPRGTDT